MSEKVKDILSAVISRLEPLGWPVISGRMIDIETDQIPCLAVQFGQIPGITSDENGRDDTARRVSRQLLELEILVCCRVSTKNALMDLEDVHTKVASVLFDHTDRRLGLLAYDDVLLESRHSYVPDPQTDVGILQMMISIPYIEEY